jgi:hypothetical protein
MFGSGIIFTKNKRYFMSVKIEWLETGVTMITLSYEGKNYVTGSLFSDEIGEKIQLLINKALEND